MNLLPAEGNTKLEIDIQSLEQELMTRSLEVEREIVKGKLDTISNSFTEENLVIEGIPCNKEIVPKDVSVGRIRVTWNRPVYVGSKRGNPVRFYLADKLVKIPEKTKGSYRILSACALLGAFLPFDLTRRVIEYLMGVKLSGSTVKRYTETVGQFASENIEDILEKKKPELELSEDEILLVSIDGSSSLINGNQRKSNKRRVKGKRKKRRKKKKGFQKMII
jgi:hypothetical protein